MALPIDIFVPKNTVIISAMIALTLFGGMIYGADDYTAHSRHDQARIVSDDLMLTIFVAPVGIVMSTVDQPGIYGTNR